MPAPETADRRDEIEAVLAELRRVWLRNPGKTLMQVAFRAAAGVAVFTPEDASDAGVLAALTAIGPGQPAPAPPPEDPAGLNSPA